MVTQDKLVTVNEFETFIARSENVDRRFELIHGEIVEKMPTQEHAFIIQVITGEIYIYLKTSPIGRGMVEARYGLPNDKHNDRMPDFSFVSDPTRQLVRKGSAPYMPDLAVEVKSPDDTYKRMREKAEYYIANGCRLVWLIFPEKRLVEVYYPNADIEILMENDSLDGHDVLPGFTLPIHELFRA
jgi:Uma2 family endonuclease